MHEFFNDSDTPEKLRRGALLEYLDSYAAVLAEQGYARHTGKIQLRIVSDFSQRLERHHLKVQHVSAEVWRDYLRNRHRRYQPRRDDNATGMRLIQWLHPGRMGKASKPTSALVQVVERFSRYLIEERGLSEAAQNNYVPVVRKFLLERFRHGHIEWKTLRAHDITRFVQRHAHRKSPNCAQLMVTALRAFLRHLLASGVLDTDFASCVPKVAWWRWSTVPKFLTSEQVQKVLDACDLQTASGRRNYAILLLLARLGLRAGEVVSLRLDNINWESGFMIIRGKGTRWAQMPLTREIGKAIIVYLKHDRPHCKSRRLFIRQRAPLTGFTNSVAICSLVQRALARAGVESARKGAHLFRHGLATEMVNRGASLSEIGELLRHRHPNTTMIYTKVHLSALRTLALPWPGGAL
jgi:site-specific recombinase XerD